MSFFRSKYDLYSEILLDPNSFEKKVSEICLDIDQRDLEQDLVDAIREVALSYGFKNSVSPLKFILECFSTFSGKNSEIAK